MAAKPVRIAIVANAAQARRELGGFESKLSRTFKKVGRVAAVGTAVAGAALVKFGADSVKSASDAQQSLGATESVFGKYADTVVKRSEQAADSVGLSANEYRELSNVTGALLKSAGTPLSKVAGLTDELTERAADMAATFGGTTKEAVEAVSSLLRGEADPIEKYGVSIKQSDINARLAAKGLGKLEGAAKKQAEQQERVALLMEQSADAAGQFDKEADTLAGSQQRLGANVEDLQAKFGDLLLPVLTDVTQWATDDLVPALEDLAGWFEENSDEIADTARTIKDTLLPPLETLGGVVKDVGGFMADLPDPLKKAAVQAGALALVLPRLTSGLTTLRATATTATGSMVTFGQRLRQNRAAMSYQATAAGKAREAVRGLGGVSRGVAGVAGIGALTAASSTSNDALKTLANVGGGAMLGFAAAGPIGAAIGGGAGLLATLAGNADDANETINSTDLHPAIADYEDLKATLDDLTGAYTQASRAAVYNDLVESGAAKALSALNITRRQAVDAVIRDGAARRQVTSSLTAEKAELERINRVKQDLIDTETGTAARDAAVKRYNDLVDEGIDISDEAIAKRKQAVASIEGEIAAGRKSQREKRREIAATRDYGKALKKLPEDVRTHLRTVGVDNSIGSVRKLVKRFDMTPKEVRTLFEVLGIEPTRKKIRNVIEDMKETGKAKPDMRPFAAAVEDGVNDAKRLAATGSAKVAEDLKKGTAKARPDLGGFMSQFQSNITTMRGNASSGGRDIGSLLGAGLNSGISGWTSTIAGTAAGAVASAVSAARREAQIRSPSRKTRYIGRQMGKGLVVGLYRSRKAARRAGKRLMQSTLQGVQSGVGRTNKTLDKVTKAIERNVRGKNQAKFERKLFRRYRDEYRALRRNARAQDRVNQRLREARQAYRSYAAQVKGTLVATGDVTTLGRLDDGTVSLGGLLGQMKNRVNDAKRFSVLIRRLRRDGLNKTAIEQMLQAGPEAALATAEAIEYGGKDAVKQINNLQTQLGRTGRHLGREMADKFAIAGRQSAEGYIRGLNRRNRQLDKAARNIARRLVRQVRKALGIRSPSKVFAGIGDDVTKGLTIGLDDTYVKRQGAKMAGQLERGFGKPALDAHAKARTEERSRVSVTLTAEQVSALERGRAVAMDLDSYYQAGGRRRAG